MSNFIHLRVHSDYSLGRGVIKLKDLVKAAATQKYPAIGLSDNGNLFASIEFSIKCLDHGIQPLVSSIIAIDYDDKAPSFQKQYGELLLIAATDIGYQNLLKLVSHSFLRNNSIATPHISLEELKLHAEGIIILCGGAKAPPSLLYHQNLTQQAVAFFNTLKSFSDDLYIELIRDGVVNDELEEFYLKIALELDLPIVATNDVHFLDPDMHEAHDAFICISQAAKLDDSNREFSNPEHYLKTAKQMTELFSDLPEAIENTLRIAKKCTVFSQRRAPLLPNYVITPGESEAEILDKYATAGLKKRLQLLNYSIDHQQYEDRLRYELSVINNMQFPGYFLIVSDFIKWSKENGIPVGPGRGSGVGSIVAWSLEITDLDPIRFGLLFERFLNPDRISMPDFDIDFCQERRDEVIAYVRNKYGEDKVASIITFGKLQARAVLRDVGRVLGMEYIAIDKICKMVPNNPSKPVTLKEAIDLDKELQYARDSDSTIAKLLELSLKLEGNNRHVSTHAAGIVIGDRPLVELLPLYRDTNSTMPAVQYNMKYVEEAGLVKFDFLGLKTLTVIAWATALIRKNHDSTFNPSLLALDDAKTYLLLTKGKTVGIFQFESAGMKEAIKKLKPDAIEDLTALGALYRPGPMDNIPKYINCKHGVEKPQYIHPAVEKLLEETYGIIVYQEQVMTIAQSLGGYTLGQADLLRRAMGKKIKAEMDAQKTIFVKGAMTNGISKSMAEEIFFFIEKFANYGFNKSHAAAYAVISYQTAYLKANFPLEFYTASINLEIDDTDKIYLFISDAKSFDIPILSPSINYSEAMFIIEGDALRYGLAAIKNVGKKIVEEIIVIRQRNGNFTSLQDFLERVGSANLNKRMLENMIKAGVFDELHNNRQQLLMNIEVMMKFAAAVEEDSNTTQLSLFEDMADMKLQLELAEYQESSPHEKLHQEFEAFGFYLSQHPIEEYLPKLRQQGVVFANDIESYLHTKSKKLSLAGVLASKKIRSSKQGKYAFLQISDNTGILDISIFDEKLLVECIKTGLLEVGSLLYIHADARKDDSGMRVIVEKMLPVSEAVRNVKTYVKVTVKKLDVLQRIKTMLSSSGAQISLFAMVDEAEIAFATETPLYIEHHNLMLLKSQEGIEVREI